MATTYFDDGSSITYDDNSVSSTPAPAGMMLSDYSSNFNPGNLSGGASSMLDVLKYGFGRVVDYKTASMQAANTAANYAQPQNFVSVPSSMQMNTGTLLLLGGAVLLFVVLSGGGKKG